MAYLRKEVAKEIRSKIKKLYPAKDGWKFSITSFNLEVLRVNIIECPSNIGFSGFHSINEFYVDEKYKDEPLKKDVLNNIIDICKESGYTWHRDEPMDKLDFSFYIELELGKYPNPCKSAGVA